MDSVALVDCSGLQLRKYLPTLSLVFVVTEPSGGTELVLGENVRVHDYQTWLPCPKLATFD